ncbi:MAG: hypothetical protein WBL53_09505 [Pseudonocardiaceae bacterium]|jgi:hypothetical protein
MRRNPDTAHDHALAAEYTDHPGQRRRPSGIPQVQRPQAFVIEAILSLGLISTILGTASSAQNIGPLSAFGVAAYIVLAGHGDAPR